MKDLNLIPKSYYQKKKEKKKKTVKVFLIFISIVVVAVAFAWPIYIKHDLSVEIERLKTLENDEFSENGSNFRVQLNEINRLYQERKLESEKINDMLKGYSFSMIMEKIEASKPDKLFLINTNYSAEKLKEKTIGLYGMAQSDVDVVQFIVNLKKSNLFKSVILKSLTKLDNGGCNFTLSTQIAGG